MKQIIQKKSFLCALILMHTVFMLQAQNTSNPNVGAIPGEIDVSPMGATTYTIPIEVVPGTQGMQPNLSIVYNSMGGMGLLGMKWNLAGLSVITRCGQSMYYDDNISNIEFYAYDRFAIDGDRLLILNSGTYGAVGGEYATEMENFSRLVSYGGEIGSPDHFKTYTDDGTIIEYGNTTNSKQTLAANKVLSWLINRITDANGNYMTFEYVKYGNEILIDKILYTGNGFQPYAKVVFNYTELPDTMGKNTYFVGGYGIPQTKLLEAITIYYENTQIRKYKFIYNTEDAGERSAHMKSVILYGETDNQQLDATTIIWGEQSIASPYFPYYYTEVLFNLTDGTTLPEGYIISGDFNGDGYMDFVIYGQEASQNRWKLYTGKPHNVPGFFVYENTGITRTHPSVTVESNCYFYKADVNGDGCDELIIASRGANQTSYLINIFSFKDGVTQIVTDKAIANFRELHFGDFDGDGAVDMLFVKEDPINSFELYISKSFMSDPVGLPSLTLPCRVRVGDFNGDGKTEIELNLNNHKLNTYSFNGVYFDYAFPQQTANYSYDRYSGDFNGDGITDLLTYEKKTGGGLFWKIYFGKGDGTYTDTTSINILNGNFEELNGWIVPKYKIMIADLDGDGKDDIIQIMFSKALKILYSKGCINNGKYKYKPIDQTIWDDFTLPKHFNVSDFNNDGILDLVVQTKRTMKPKVVYLHKNRQSDFVKQITDGLGKVIKLTYKPKYYIALLPNTSNKFIKFFLYPLDTLHVSNGLNGFNTLKYKYDAPAFSIKKRTFLGFEEFISINNLENISNQSLFAIDASQQIMKPAKQMSFCGNQKTNEKIFTIELKRLDKNRFAYNYLAAEESDMLSDTKIVTSNTLNPEGRVATNSTKIYNSCNTTDWLHSETRTYTYQTITLNGYQKKTVPTQILTTQQYGSNGTVISDTLTYGYYPASDKGRLAWMRKGNIHGVIKTNYDSYSSTGVCYQKTVSAKDCPSRIEKYEYDDTRRFVKKITNPLNQEATFTYNLSTGNKLSEKDINDLTTTYQYDAFGNLTQINYPDGTKTNTSVKWQTASSPTNAKYYTTTISSGKPSLEIYYDVLGREVCRKDDGYYYQTVYNNKGQVEKTSGPFYRFNEPDIIWHNYTYDEYGRKKTEKAPYLDLSYTYNNRKATVTDNLRKVSSFKNYDALGRITVANDPGGNINYAYEVTPSKQHKTTISTHGATTTLISDLWGNRLSITDPDAGKITSEYNKFNELTKQTDARGNITDYQYDKLGRVTQKKYTGNDEPLKIIKYTYDNYTSYNRGRGKIYQVLVNNEVEETYFYDGKSRLYEHIKVVENEPYTFSYGYTQTGQLSDLTYPDGFTVKYNYSSTGKLTEIRSLGYWGFDDELIYKVVSRNKYNSPTRCEYGNELATDYTYDSNGLLTRINTGNKITVFVNEPGENNRGGEISNPNQTAYYVDSTILNYRYAFDPKGLMSSRSERVINRLETFTYDNLDRLTETKSGLIGQTGVPQAISYQNNGNISGKFGVGYYTYLSNKPHAVYYIDETSQSIFPGEQCAVEYNLFNQPTKITDGDNEINLFYGSNQQRNKAVFFNNDYDSENSTRYYINKYYEIEEVVFRPQFDRHYCYIYGDNGVVALHIENNQCYNKWSSDSIFYIHTDHLGSYCAITNANKQVVMRNHFDPWGKHVVRDIKPNYLPFTFTNRGFTGHEHYPQFKIINMNGRLYDPVIARFFSPDKYVANSSFTQDFNRYTYARNNPLKYTDPSGHKITGYDVWNFIMFPVFLPARLLSEGFTWLNDKINGNTRYGGYFAPSYLIGQTAPGSLTPYNPVNLIPFGQPGYSSSGTYMNRSGSVAFGTGWAMGADNEWNEYATEFALKAPIRKKKTMAEKIYSAEDRYRLEHGAPIPQQNKNAEFIERMQRRWFRKALNPSGGYLVETFEEGNGYARPHVSNGLLTGGSTVGLHEERAFTSFQQLYLTLGHELLHVSQINELAGESYTRTYENSAFRDMMEHYASKFSSTFLFGSISTPFVSEYSEYHARMKHTYYSWSNKTSWTFWLP